MAAAAATAAAHASLVLPRAPTSSSPSPTSAILHPDLQPPEADTSPLIPRLIAVLRRTWHLGLTSFGGPPVHFAILHRRFVQLRSTTTTTATATTTTHEEPWLDEQTFQELFAVCQALPGPGSTKLLFCIVLVHAGAAAAFMVFFLWSLPGAAAMYGLALGVGNVGEVLPAPVYALLSGLNAGTVGVVALAAVQLADKAIKDRMTRLLVIWGGCAGLCYNALWYFPTLIVVGGVVCGIWETRGARTVQRLKLRWMERKRREQQPRLEAADADANTDPTVHGAAQMQPIEDIRLEVGSTTRQSVQRRRRANEDGDKHQATAESSRGPTVDGDAEAATPVQRLQQHQRQHQQEEETMQRSTPRYYAIPISTGIGFLALLFAIFLALILSRSLLANPPRPLAVFASMYQAGILIFGGGPVVIPLLRDYVVDPGWVSSRDFLIGLAIIQAMPGPNFNFSVYLGALAMAGTGFHSLLGALLGFVGIFAPGLLLTLGVHGLWSLMRTKPVVLSVLKGINATAVGLVFTAVYRLWEIGYLTPQDSRGKSLAEEPWWLVVAALTYCEVAYFSVPPAVAIVAGAVLGLCWYGAVGRA